VDAAVLPHRQDAGAVTFVHACPQPARAGAPDEAPEALGEGDAPTRATRGARATAGTPQRATTSGRHDEAPAAPLARDLGTARRLLVEARALARSASSRAAEANALLYLGQLALEEADPTTARSHLSAGLRLTREKGVSTHPGPRREPPYVFLLWLGHAAEAAGEPAKAGPEYAEARELARANGDTFFEAVAARGQASVAIQQRNIAAARRLLREAAVLSRSLDDTTIACGTLLAHFARLAAAEGHPERALRLPCAAAGLVWPARGW
jgi:hypothetical protein